MLEALCKDVQGPVLPLFVLCANGKSKTGENRDCVVPRPLPASPVERAQHIAALVSPVPSPSRATLSNQLVSLPRSLLLLLTFITCDAWLVS